MTSASTTWTRPGRAIPSRPRRSSPQLSRCPTRLTRRPPRRRTRKIGNRQHRSFPRRCASWSNLLVAELAGMEATLRDTLVVAGADHMDVSIRTDALQRCASEFERFGLATEAAGFKGLPLVSGHLHANLLALAEPEQPSLRRSSSGWRAVCAACKAYLSAPGVPATRRSAGLVGSGAGVVGAVRRVRQRGPQGGSRRHRHAGHRGCRVAARECSDAGGCQPRGPGRREPGSARRAPAGDAGPYGGAQRGGSAPGRGRQPGGRQHRAAPRPHLEGRGQHGRRARHRNADASSGRRPPGAGACQDAADQAAGRLPHARGRLSGGDERDTARGGRPAWRHAGGAAGRAGLGQPDRSRRIADKSTRRRPLASERIPQHAGLEATQIRAAAGRPVPGAGMAPAKARASARRPR